MSDKAEESAKLNLPNCWRDGVAWVQVGGDRPLNHGHRPSRAPLAWALHTVGTQHLDGSNDHLKERVREQMKGMVVTTMLWAPLNVKPVRFT